MLPPEEKNYRRPKEFLMTQRVEPLKKLQLRMTLTSNAETEPITFTHIFGLAPEGLSPFEAMLDGKKQGDAIQLSIPATGLSGIFRNLHRLTEGSAEHSRAAEDT